MSQQTFSRFNDDPPRLFFWSIDEIVPASTMFVVGAMTGNILLYGVIGIALSMAVGRAKDYVQDGYAVHFLSWYGVMPLKGRCVINPFIRRILPL